MTISSVVPCTRSRVLALSAYFKQPELGMKKYEILSRASAFLLGVDPPSPESTEAGDGPYGHLANRKRRVQTHELKTDSVDRGYLKSPAGGPKGRGMTELGWLEYCPVEFRPAVHVVAAAHVLAPFREPWLSMYYAEQGGWLGNVRQEHCKYAVEVYDTSSNGRSTTSINNCLAKFALNPYPIHHPGNLDLSIIHLKDESAALKQMKSLGVESLFLRDDNAKPFVPDEQIDFEGFEVALPDGTDRGNVLAESLDWEDDEDDSLISNAQQMTDDERIFMSYKASGKLIYASQERLLASTDIPLPDGLCGGPALDQNGLVTGVVEGIVPLSHKNNKVAGAAAFISAGAMKSFVDMAEMRLLEKIIPAELYERVVTLKSGKKIGSKDSNGKEFPLPSCGGSNGTENVEKGLDNELEQMLQTMSKHMSAEELNKFTGEIEIQTREVIEMLERGEATDIMEAVNKVQQTYVQSESTNAGMNEDQGSAVIDVKSATSQPSK